MRKFLLALALLAWPAVALATTPTWAVDRPASTLGFASSFNDTAFVGVFRRWTAQIQFDPANLPQSSVLVTIDVASAFTGSPDRDQSLPTADWFDVHAHPTATFRATQFRALGGNRYQATGVLSLRGVSRPLTLPFTLAITGQGAHQSARMTASVPLNRLTFGVGQGQWATGDAVPTTVTVNVALAAHRTS